MEGQSSLLTHFPGKARSVVTEHEQQAAPTHAGNEGDGGDGGVEPIIEPTDTPRKRFCSGELNARLMNQLDQIKVKTLQMT